MEIANLSRWLIGAAIAAAAAGIHASDAQAQVPRVAVVGYFTSGPPSCRPDATSFYTVEARGFGLGNVKLCETFTQGTTAMATCDAGPLQHESRVTRRTEPTFQYQSLVKTSGRANWGTPGPTLNVSVPSSTDCPGGATIQLQSYGLTLPNG